MNCYFFHAYLQYLLIIKTEIIMVEIVHRYHGFYPFGKAQQGDHEYLQVLRQKLTQQQLNSLKQRAKIVQSIICNNLIKIHKILREDNNLHIIYEYYKISIQEYLQSLKIKYSNHIPKESYGLFLAIFKENVDKLIATLIKYQIKENIRLSNMGVSLQPEKEIYILKYFMDTEAEFLELNIIQQINNPNKNFKQSAKNKEELHEFYEAERKSLMIEIQELTEKYFGYVYETNDIKKTPNFVIQGTKLIFVNKQQQKKSLKQQQFILKQLQQKNPSQKNENSENNIAQKIQKKNIKIPQDQKGRVIEIIKQNKQKLKSQINKKVIKPIINFDQSFQPIFQPEEIIRDKTYIVQQNQYIQQLQEQIQDLLSNSNKTDNSKNSGREGSKDYQKPDKVQSTKQPSLINTKATQKSDINNNNNNSYQNSNSSMNDTPSGNTNNNNNNQTKVNQYFNNKTQIKCQRLTKYKMKITTLHEIQINDNKQPNLEEIEHDIMNNIMTGKINMNHILNNNNSNNNNENNTVNSQSIEDKLVKSNSKQVSPSNTFYTVVHNQNQQETQSPKLEHQTPNLINAQGQRQIKIENKQIAELIQNNRLKAQQKLNQNNGIKTQQSANSLKHQKQKISLNTIIKNQPQKSIKMQLPPLLKQEIALDQKQIEEFNKKNKINKMIEKISVNHKALISVPVELQEKVVVPVVAVERQPVQQPKTVDSNQKKQNYLEKVRQVKSKAQQILKQYTKKKA